MALQETQAELAEIQRQLDLVGRPRVSADCSPAQLKRYALLLAREELLLLELYRAR